MVVTTVMVADEASSKSGEAWLICGNVTRGPNFMGPLVHFAAA